MQLRSGKIINRSIISSTKRVNNGKGMNINQMMIMLSDNFDRIRNINNNTLLSRREKFLKSINYYCNNIYFIEYWNLSSISLFDNMVIASIEKSKENIILMKNLLKEPYFLEKQSDIEIVKDLICQLNMFVSNKPRR